jgi:hypothetical protein
MSWMRYVRALNFTKDLSGNLKGRDHLGGTRIDGKIILKWVENKQILKMWTAFISLRTESSGVGY